MSTAVERQEEKAIENVRFNARISASVLAALGTPDDLYDVQVRPVMICRYRVNVRTHNVAEMETCAMKTINIANSFYVAVNEDGAVVNSSPPIKRMYEKRSP